MAAEKKMVADDEGFKGLKRGYSSLSIGSLSDQDPPLVKKGCAEQDPKSKTEKDSAAVQPSPVGHDKGAAESRPQLKRSYATFWDLEFEDSSSEEELPPLPPPIRSPSPSEKAYDGSELGQEEAVDEAEGEGNEETSSPSQEYQLVIEGDGDAAGGPELTPCGCAICRELDAMMSITSDDFEILSSPDSDNHGEVAENSLPSTTHWNGGLVTAQEPGVSTFP